MNQLLLEENLPDHLPDDMPLLLEACLQILRESKLSVHLVWLFGSYARGNFIRDCRINERGQKSTYRSDVDLLLIVDGAGPGRIKHQSIRLRKIFQNNPAIKERIHFLCIEAEELNSELCSGNFFYGEVLEEGCLLVDSGEVTIAEFQPPNHEQMQLLAETNFVSSQKIVKSATHSAPKY